MDHEVTASRLDEKTRVDSVGRVLRTAFGLIFGAIDLALAFGGINLIRAIDTKTGKMLWSDILRGIGQANPTAYEHNGKEYFVITAGRHHFIRTPQSDQLVAYAVPGGGK